MQILRDVQKVRSPILNRAELLTLRVEPIRAPSRPNNFKSSKNSGFTKRFQYLNSFGFPKILCFQSGLGTRKFRVSKIVRLPENFGI